VDENAAEVVSAGPVAEKLEIEGVGEKGERMPEIRRRGGEGKPDRFRRKPPAQDRIEDGDGIVVIDESERRGRPEA
jgi:hypothetical protein